MIKLIPKKWLCCLSLLVLFCVLPFASTISVGAHPTQKVEMSLEQFNNLREMVNELQTQSQTLKTQLTESQEALTKAQVYLTDYKQNLTELQKQTDSMRRSEKRMERQRNLAWLIAGGLLVWGASR